LLFFIALFAFIPAVLAAISPSDAADLNARHSQGTHPIEGGKVTQQKIKWSTLVLILGALMFLSACKKKPAPPPPPPPPPPPAPTASLTASPNSVDKGQSTTLTWQTTNATDVSIDGIGAVQPSGSQQVTPADSTTYHLVAKGAGGTQEATARVTVNAPPPPPPPQASATEEQLFSQNVKDIYFNYDAADIRGDQQTSLQGDIEFLKQHPNVRFSIEGHCDERGSTEYNLALGDNRAAAVKTALTQAGISADRIRTISYGKERPFCTESNESCWQQNRRGHFVYEK
jgi:peptidoglycan-associated lipoprotein